MSCRTGTRQKRGRHINAQEGPRHNEDLSLHLVQGFRGGQKANCCVQDTFREHCGCGCAPRRLLLGLWKACCLTSAKRQRVARSGGYKLKYIGINIILCVRLSETVGYSMAWAK